jgi:hypothetical protein
MAKPGIAAPFFLLQLNLDYQIVTMEQKRSSI